MKNRARTMLLLFGDVVTLIMAFFFMLYVAFPQQHIKDVAHLHALPFFILGIIWIIIFFIFNLYSTQATRPTIPHLQHIALAFIVALVISMGFFYIIPLFYIAPKTNLLIFNITSFIFFITWRRIFYNIFASYFRKDVVFIVGKNNNKLAKDLENYIKLYPQSGFNIAGIYETLEEFFKNQNGTYPQVFLVSKDIWHNEENFKKLYNTKSEIMDLAYAYEDILGKIPLEAIDESWFMHNVQSSQKKIDNVIERIFVIILAILILLITSPVLLIIAILIKISDGGHIFYSQTRTGKNSENFELHKFRSMVPNAEKNGPEWSSKEDTRVTPVGKIIRTLHFDEIPQMWNVIKGDITLIGPRPERPEFVEKLEKEIPFYYLRHNITPGFTGWAQIKFHYAGNVMDSKEKFEYDLYYLKNRNIFMDLGILLRTIQIIFTH